MHCICTWACDAVKWRHDCWWLCSFLAHEFRSSWKKNVAPTYLLSLLFFPHNTKHGWKLTTKFALPRCGSWKFCSKHALFKLTLGRIRAVYLILTQPISRASCLPAQHGPELLHFPFSRHDARHDNMVWWANQPFFLLDKIVRSPMLSLTFLCGYLVKAVFVLVARSTSSSSRPFPSSLLLIICL